MKERIKDIIAGIFSIIFIAIVFYLYFIRVFSGYSYFDNSGGNFDNFITYNQSQHQSCHINIIEPTIVLRIDDIRAYSILTQYLVNEIINRNLSATLGVIPYNLEKDKILQKYLLNIRENPNIEIAQHGTYHNESDINISEEELLSGNIKIQETLGVKPITYIPLYNNVTTEAKNMISKYFKIISGEQEILKEGEKIAEIGYTTTTYFYTQNQTNPIEQIVEKCKQSLHKTNLCVVALHPQEYSTDINNPSVLSKEKFEEFKLILDKLQELNARFSTFKDIAACSD